MKQDGHDLHHKDVDESIIDSTDFLRDADVNKKGSTVILAILFYHLDDILGGHPVKDEALAQFSHAEKILKLLSLQTKNAKAKQPAKCNNGWKKCMIQ